MQDRLELHLLGTPQAFFAGERLDLPTQKTLAILCYLALQDKPVSREELTDMLWGPGRSKNLRQALYSLRSMPGSEVWLVEEDDSLDVLAVTDVFSFDEMLMEGKLSEALDLWAWQDEGTFLAGLQPKGADPFLEWLEFERARLEQNYFEALAEHAEELEQSEAYDTALTAIEALLDYDDLNETAHRAAMRLEYLLGRPEKALERYRICRHILIDQLAVEPQPETLALARQIEQSLPQAPSAEEQKFQIPLSILRPPQLVGREQVWQEVEEAWLVRQAIFVRAPAGFGKTRFVQDFTRSKGDTLRFEGRPSDALVPYASLARWLYRALSSLPKRKFEPWVSYELSRLIPELSEERASAISSNEGKLRFFEAAIQVIGEASWGLMAIVIDDLQFCDPASIEAMLYLQTKLIPSTLHSSIHVAVRSISAYRQGELAAEIEAQIETLVDQGMAKIIDLAPLGDRSVVALLKSLDIGLDDAYIASFAKRLQGHTGGNPLFIVESLKSMFEAGGIHDVKGNLPLPDKVGRLIENRLERLAPMSYQLLRVLALSPSLDADVAAAVLNVDLFEISQAYEALEEAQMLREGKLVHDLLEETVCSILPEMMKRHLHQRIAEQLEQGEAQAHLIAHHWSAAAKVEKALPWRLKAVKQAILQGQLSQAQDWLSEILKQADEGYLLIESQVLLGRLRASFDVNQSRQHLLAALEAARERGFRDLEVAALIALAHLATVMGNQQEAQMWIDQALLQRESIDQELALELMTTHFNVAVRSGQVTQAEAILNEALEHFDQPQLILEFALLKWHQGDFREGAMLLERLIAEQPVLSQIMTLDNNLGMTYWALGESERGMSRLRESTRIWQAQGATYQEALSRSNLGLIYISLGRFSLAQEELVYAETAFKAQGSMTSLADVYQRRGTLAYFAGHFEEALSYYQQASDLMSDVGDIFRVSYHLASFANGLAQMGKFAKAKQTSDEAIALAELTGHPIAKVLAYQSAVVTGLPQAHRLILEAQSLAESCQMVEQWAFSVWLESRLCLDSRSLIDKLYKARDACRRLRLLVAEWLCIEELMRLGEPLQEAYDQAYQTLSQQAPFERINVQADGAALKTSLH